MILYCIHTIYLYFILIYST